MATKKDEKDKKPSQDDVLLREVDQELAEERQWALFRKHGPIVIAAASVAVLGVAGSQIWSSLQNRSAEASAAGFREAIEQLETAPADGRVALDQFSADAPGGYRVLALMRRASSLVQEGETNAARAVYREVYSDGAAPQRLQHYAQLRAAMISLNEGRDAVLEDLGDLRFDESALGFHARELEAVAALKAGDYGTARSMFLAASTNLETPSGVRQRAEEYGALASAAVAGVSVPDDVTATTPVEPVGLGLGLPAGFEEALAQGAEAALGEESTPADEALGANEASNADEISGSDDASGSNDASGAGEASGVTPDNPSTSDQQSE